MFDRKKTDNINMGVTVEPVLSGHSKRRQKKMIFKTDYRLMQVKSIAGCSMGRILQYFQPSLCYHLSLRPLFCLFLSGRFTQVLLYSFWSALEGQSNAHHIDIKKVIVVMQHSFVEAYSLLTKESSRAVSNYL